MEASLARIKERLEKETSMHIETKQRISELQDNLETLSRQINNEKSERKRLEQLVASGSLPDDAKATLKIVEDEVLEKVETKPTPPPPPPPPLAPPPPPCMMPAAPPPMKVTIIRYNFYNLKNFTPTNIFNMNTKQCTKKINLQCAVRKSFFIHDNPSYSTLLEHIL